MKSTGIIRRIDDLGRVVVPKEIRRNLRLREGDPVEIFTEGDAVCFKKYDVTGDVQQVLTNAEEYIKLETELSPKVVNALLGKIDEMKTILKEVAENEDN